MKPRGRPLRRVGPTVGIVGGVAVLGIRKYAREQGALLRARREALGVSVEAMAAMTRRIVTDYECVESGISPGRDHDSDRFVVGSALCELEDRARADLDSWTRDHPDADRAALLVVYPRPVLGG